MDISAYDIIKKISVTSKSRTLFDKFGKITFVVHKDANKIMIKKAVEKVWAVKIANVCVLNVKGKAKAFARKRFQTSDIRKAIVTLKPGYKIELPGQFESMGVAGASEARAKE